ncbi:MAG: hypothetical protein ACT4QG_11725 [Sporichthyaceae bacterium]
MRTLLSPAAPAVAAAVLLSVSAPVHAAEPTSMTCQRAGHLTITPGITAEDRDFTFTERGRFLDCRAPDGTVLSGDVAVNGAKGRGGCSGATIEDVPFTVRWSNGQSSSGVANAKVTGPAADVSATIVEGLFEGTKATSLAFLIPADPSGCLGGGLTEVDYVGTIRFELES